MQLPDLNKYQNGTLPIYYFQKTFYLLGKWYEPGDLYDTYHLEYTYDELIWRLRENVIGTTKPENVE